LSGSLSPPARTQFDCLHAGYLSGFHGKSQQSADDVPSIVAAGAGVHVNALPPRAGRLVGIVDQATHNKIVSFIWGIADDVLRDLFKRGKYPDVILPMCVIRRMDAVLEPTKRAVLDTKKMLDEAGITEQRAALTEAAGQAFYNTSKFTLRDLKSRGSQQQLLADFEDYLNGFSPNVQDIVENFKFATSYPRSRRQTRSAR
jgi:hypothetical protein